MCRRGDHAFPIEDDAGAYCPEHGITLLFHGDPITPDDLAYDYPSRPERHALEPVNNDARPH
ncbi:hypothetical protein [Streptomyces sp. NP-1717]|uniref:hypothetical protein n=1 Tax=Streptomyces sp. NP-1717 TaxID=2704470 RepID=UPI001F5C0E09|nr:hypothetical protein [Streptomyces sp. NP-1717]MCI3226333.1 hypothetical protein [Streptomyces sp. NP-1717]